VDLLLGHQVRVDRLAAHAELVPGFPIADSQSKGFVNSRSSTRLCEGVKSKWGGNMHGKVCRIKWTEG
jgi:hypothetical protein